jgi:hypothetical protein
VSELGQFALALAWGGALIALLVGPVGQALGSRIRGRPASTEGLTSGEMAAERIAMLEDRINELEQERGRLEERLEFAERMLLSGKREAES